MRTAALACALFFLACGGDSPGVSSDSVDSTDLDALDAADSEAPLPDSSEETSPDAVSPPPPLVWGPCADEEGRIECASLDVPVSDADPDERVTLHITRALALEPENRIGALFVNPGGLGAGAAEMLEVMATGQDRHTYLARYFDLIGVDWRGTGGSSPKIQCTDPSDWQIYETMSPTEAEAFRSQVLSDCRAALGDAFLLSVDAATVARYMDRVRASLGEETINFYGASYGTRLGAVYATLFSDRVRAFVLDAPVPPTTRTRGCTPARWRASRSRSTASSRPAGRTVSAR